MGLALLLSGCIFSPKKGAGGGGIEPPKYLVPESPEFVMLNLKEAYTKKDSTGYKACFDPNYFGTSQDVVLQTPIDTLTFAKEAEHIASLARSAATVELELKPAMVRSTDSGDPAGWALIQNPIQSLGVYDGGNSFIVTPTQEIIEFRFIPKTPDSSSPTDTTWKIVKWNEIRS
ncbi:MAG TPA: hypothetical protein VGK76_03385 [Candidatus Eisenbacteria bacterium]